MARVKCLVKEVIPHLCLPFTRCIPHFTSTKGMLGIHIRQCCTTCSRLDDILQICF